MKSRSVLIVTTAVLVSFCLLTIGFAIISLVKIPKIENQIPPGSTPVHVQLDVPPSPSGWPLNSYLPVSVKAMGGGTIASIELFINGQLYERISTPVGWSASEYGYRWSWQPGTTGIFILVARASNMDGGFGVSTPVQIFATPATMMVTPYKAQAGETLSQIADIQGINLAELQNVNPEITDSGAEIPVGTEIDLPAPPAKITNPNIISGISEGTDYVQIPDGLQEIEETVPVKPDDSLSALPSFQDLQFWLVEKTNGASKELPPSPNLKSSTEGCNAILVIDPTLYADSGGQTNAESGFFVYRSVNGDDFVRIATLPAVTTPDSWIHKAGYMVAKQSGAVTFTISAFNSAGENSSNPVTVKFDKSTCKDSGSTRRNAGWIFVNDGELILPYWMDLAYLYLSIDGSSSIRVPEGHRMFQPGSGMRLNIFDYLAEQMPAFAAADFSLSMEVWGWRAGKLVFVGKFVDEIHRSVLLVCSQEGEGACSNGSGSWETEINFSDQKPVDEQIYEFKWIAPGYSETDEVCIQAAAAPYTSENYWNMGAKPIYAGCYYWDGKEYVHGSEGIFTQQMHYLLYDPTPPDDLGWGGGSKNFDFGSNWFANEYPPDSAFTIYFRFLPHLDDNKINIPFSNVVTLHHDTAPVPSELPPLASPFNSIYGIEILRDSYSPPTFQTDEKWGCVIVDEDPTNTFAVGQEVCPPPYGTLAKLNSDGCNGNWDFWCTLKGVFRTFTESWDAIAYWYDFTKYQWASMIAETIPYCGGNEDCIVVIKKVMDKVIKEGTGLPENLPKSEDLISKNAAKLIVNSAVETEKYFSEQEYSVIEAGCSVYKCEEKLAEAIKQEMQHKRSIAAQPACIDSYQAYFKGKDAVCLDPSIIVHAAPGGSNKFGAVIIKITRKMNIESVGVQEADAGNYRLHFTVDGENGTLSGQLFPPILQDIPWIEPSESTLIAVELPIIGGEINEPLYFGGISHMKAVEACYSPDSSVEWVPCINGGADSWDFKNPVDKKTSEIGQP